MSFNQHPDVTPVRWMDSLDKGELSLEITAYDLNMVKACFLWQKHCLYIFLPGLDEHTEPPLNLMSD